MKPKQLALAIGFILCALFSRARALADQAPPIIWGPATNGLRAGVRIQQVLKEGSDAVCQTVIYFGITNLTKEVRAYCPKSEELFLAELIDSGGRPVAKTRLGARFGQAPAQQAKLSDRPPGGPNRWQLCIVTSSRESQIAHFNIKDHFMTSKPGKNWLRIQVHLYRQSSTGHLEILELPTVRAPVVVP